MPPKLRKVPGVTTSTTGRAKIKSAVKGKLANTRPTTGKSTLHKGHDLGVKKKTRPPVSRSRPGYTLYSTASDAQAGEVDKGLNKCASIVKQMLDVRKGKVVKKDRGPGKAPISTKSQDLPMLSREATPATHRDHVGSSEEIIHSPRQTNRLPLVIPTATLDVSQSPLKRQQLPPGELGFQELPPMRERPALFNNRLATSTPDPEKIDDDAFSGRTAPVSHSTRVEVSNPNLESRVSPSGNHGRIPIASDAGAHRFPSYHHQHILHAPRADLTAANISRASPGATMSPRQYQHIAAGYQDYTQRSNITESSSPLKQVPPAMTAIQGQVSGVRPMKFLSNLLMPEDSAQLSRGRNVSGGQLETSVPRSDIYTGMENIDDTTYEHLPSPSAVFNGYKSGSSIDQHSSELGFRKSEGFIPVIHDQDERRSQSFQNSPRDLLMQRTHSMTSDLVSHSTNQVQTDRTTVRITSDTEPHSSNHNSDRLPQNNVGYPANPPITSQPVNMQITAHQPITVQNFRTSQETSMVENNPCYQGKAVTNSVTTQVSPRDLGSYSVDAGIPVSQTKFSENDYITKSTLVRQNTTAKLSHYNSSHGGFNIAQVPEYQNIVPSPGMPGIFQSAYGKLADVDSTPTTVRQVGTEMASAAISANNMDYENEGKSLSAGSTSCANRLHPSLANLKDGMVRLKSLKVLVGQLRKTCINQGYTDLETLSKDVEDLVGSLPQDGSMFNIHTEIDLALQPLLSENNQLRRRFRIVTQQLKDRERQHDAQTTPADPEAADQNDDAQSEGRIRTLEKVLDSEKMKSSTIQAELRQCQCDLEQYKADRQKLLIALGEKDSDKLKLRQDSLQKVSKLRREVELAEQRTEGYKLKHEAAEKENHILAITLKQRDAEMNRLQEIVHTLKERVSEVINELSSRHGDSSQLTTSFNLQKLERLLREGNCDSMDFGPPSPSKSELSIQLEIPAVGIHVALDGKTASDGFNFENHGRQLDSETDFPMLTMDALAKHNERSLFDMGTRLGPDGHVSNDDDKDDDSDDSDNTLEGDSGNIPGTALKQYMISSETSSEPTCTTKDEHSVDTVKAKTDADLHDRVEQLRSPTKRVHFNVASLGDDYSEETQDIDAQSCRSSAVCDEPSRYSVTDYFKKYPEGNDQVKLNQVQNKINPSSSTPVKSGCEVQLESAYRGDNPSKPSLVTGNMNSNSTETVEIPSSKRPPIVPRQPPLRTLDDDNTSTISALTLSSISTLATVDESAFREGLASLDANIARLQQSLLQKKALLS